MNCINVLSPALVARWTMSDPNFFILDLSDNECAANIHQASFMVFGKIISFVLVCKRFEFTQWLWKHHLFIDGVVVSVILKTF